jgi:translocator protein
VGAAASVFTEPNISDWYAGLTHPSFAPPNWVFAPVWTTLYVLMAVSAWRVWRKTGWRSTVMALWFAQLALNLAWSFVFFGLHAPLPAFVELAALWLTLTATVLVFARIDRPAAWLLIPYWAWVGFAGVLNFWVWRLNSG